MFQVNPLLRRGFTGKKNQALFSSKDKSKKLKCRLLQFLFGALRVNLDEVVHIMSCLFWIGTVCPLVYKFSMLYSMEKHVLKFCRHGAHPQTLALND